MNKIFLFFLFCFFIFFLCKKALCYDAAVKNYGSNYTKFDNNKNYENLVLKFNDINNKKNFNLEKKIKLKKNQNTKIKKKLLKKVKELKKAKVKRKKELLRQLKKSKKEEKRLKKQELRCKLLNLNIDFINEKLNVGCRVKMKRYLQHRLKKLTLQREIHCKKHF